MNNIDKQVQIEKQKEIEKRLRTARHFFSDRSMFKEKNEIVDLECLLNYTENLEIIEEIEKKLTILEILKDIILKDMIKNLKKENDENSR